MSERKSQGAAQIGLVGAVGLVLGGCLDGGGHVKIEVGAHAAQGVYFSGCSPYEQLEPRTPMDLAQLAAVDLVLDAGPSAAEATYSFVVGACPDYFPHCSTDNCHPSPPDPVCRIQGQEQSWFWFLDACPDADPQPGVAYCWQAQADGADGVRRCSQVRSFSVTQERSAAWHQTSWYQFNLNSDCRSTADLTASSDGTVCLSYPTETYPSPSIAIPQEATALQITWTSTNAGVKIQYCSTALGDCSGDGWPEMPRHCLVNFTCANGALPTYDPESGSSCGNLPTLASIELSPFCEPADFQQLRLVAGATETGPSYLEDWSVAWVGRPNVIALKVAESGPHEAGSGVPLILVRPPYTTVLVEASPHAGGDPQLCLAAFQMDDTAGCECSGEGDQAFEVPAHEERKIRLCLVDETAEEVTVFAEAQPRSGNADPSPGPPLSDVKVVAIGSARAAKIQLRLLGEAKPACKASDVVIETVDTHGNRAPLAHPIQVALTLHVGDDNVELETVELGDDIQPSWAQHAVVLGQDPATLTAKCMDDCRLEPGSLLLVSDPGWVRLAISEQRVIANGKPTALDVTISDSCGEPLPSGRVSLVSTAGEVGVCEVRDGQCRATLTVPTGLCPGKAFISLGARQELQSTDQAELVLACPSRQSMRKPSCAATTAPAWSLLLLTAVAALRRRRAPTKRPL